jgi:hypothetical protein
MDDSALQSTLLVFGLILYLVCYVAFQGLRARLSTVPHQALALQQQISSLTAEASAAEMSRLKIEEELEELRQENDRTKTRLLEAKQAFHEAQHRLPTVVYVLDQIIQASYTPWVITVRWDYPPKGVAGVIAAEMLRGRRVLVFADNAGNVRRRVEARFPAGQGYHIGEPAVFEL